MPLPPPALLLLAGLLGLVIGSFLNVLVYRLPAGIPLTRQSRCPHCEAPVRWWQNVPVGAWFALRGRCASCRGPISWRYPLVEAATAAAFVAVARLAITRSTASPAATLVLALAFCYLASISIALTLLDLDTRRLPRVIVAPSYLVALLLFTLACLLGVDWGNLLRALTGMVLLYTGYLLLRLIRPEAMGGGDVRLAGLLGLHLGWLGWAPLAVGAFAAFLLGGVFGSVLIALHRAERSTAMPFGGWMIAGAWVGVVGGEAVGHWYGAFYG